MNEKKLNIQNSPGNQRMIMFDHENKRFVFRTVAVIIEDDHILLHKIKGHDFWFLPGGRVEFGEDAGTAIIREMKEEVGYEFGINRLVWVVENFFFHDRKDYHELSFFFLLSFRENLIERTGLEFDRIDNGTQLNFKWFPVSKVSDIHLVPSFLKSGLNKLPEQTTYIVHEDKDY